ncbi:MAG: hypothetical protein NTV81_00035 [Candidatus Komeilibacteria bacterium]|nr:hypothetical protein [Candidatus Komeilibacteria bacterium]
MAKRRSAVGNPIKTHSKKTKKRLAVKHEMLKARAAKHKNKRK